MEKIALAQLINPLFLDEIKQAETENDPLQIIKDYRFTEADYQDAQDFKQHVIVENHDFRKNDQGQYEFTLFLANGFLKFDLKITFSSNKILKYEIESLIHNYGKNALKIIGLEYFLHYFIRENPTEETNTAAHLLLNRFKNQDNDLPIILQANLKQELFDDYPSLTFKLGQPGHLYKLNSLQSLVENVMKQREVDLGKFFKRIVDLSKMDEESRFWYDLIAQVVDSNEAVQLARNQFNRSNLSEIPLKASIADQVNGFLRNGVTLSSDGKKLKYETNKRKLPLKIIFDEKQHVAQMLVDFFLPKNEEGTLIEGNQHYYYLTSSKWICYEEFTPQFLRRYGLKVGDKLVFGAKSLQTLGRQILPEFKESNNFEITGMQKLVASLPAEAEFEFKLDFIEQKIVCLANVKYGERSLPLLAKDNLNLVREIEKEEKVNSLLKKLGFKKEKDSYELDLGQADLIDYFFAEGLNQLKHTGKVKASAAFRRLLGNSKNKFNFHLGISLSQNTLKLDLADSDLTTEDVELILSAYQQKRHYVMLRNAHLQKVDQPAVEQLAQMMDNLHLNLQQFVHGKLEIPAYRAFYLDRMLKARNDLTYSSDNAFQKLISDIQQQTLKSYPAPKGLKGVLRPYQQTGYNWLSQLRNYQLNGLLADEMGLGKTIQVISLLLANYQIKPTPSLIVTPASVLYNWQNELKKFAPDLPVLILGGGKVQRKQALAKLKNQVVLTSYDSLKRDLELYQDLKFDFEILDEAQYIKNAKSLAAKSVKVIQANHRFALTGTPIENNLSELWSIFDFLMPGFLGKYDYFKNNYEKPIVEDNDQKQAKKLSEIIAPFVLRRLKKDVLKDLPEKAEHLVKVKLIGKQNTLYEAQTKHLLTKLGQKSDLDFKKQRIEVLAEITKLRQLCCDPHLLYEDYRGKSAKLQAGVELIQTNLAQGHKILVFSQFTSMLAIFKQKLAKLDLPYYEITGKTPKIKRQEMIAEFNQRQDPAVFLISLKAGGTGVNLTSADVVIHYDPWWNLSAEKQATDRAHRIGQKHNVQIYKLIAENTIEEKIIELQTRKDKLAKDLLASDKLSFSNFNKEQILKILTR